MRPICLRRVFSTSIPRLRTKQAIKAHEQGLTSEQVEELIRDPPPPANFPVFCRENPPLRHLLQKIDQSVFQRNGLHNIPYRDDRKKFHPPLTFDGKTWPERAKLREIPLVEEGAGDIVDVWTLQARQAALEEREFVQYYDIKRNTLTMLIRAIKWPEEMRLLPHIIREWHRRGFPVTEVDAGRIARKATEFDEMDVVFQMMHPEVYGLYYDIHGIREITQGMARRASSRPKEGERGLRPEEVLNRIPEVLNCSFAKDSKLVLRDPAIIGTQLWGFVWRFNNDPKFRTYQFLEEKFVLADRFITLTLDSEITAKEAALVPKDQRAYVYQRKRQFLEYIPSINAIRQLLSIITSPYRTIHNAITKLENPNEDIQKLGRQLGAFCKGRMHEVNPLDHVPSKAEIQHPRHSANGTSMWWAKLNLAVLEALKAGEVKARGMSDWQWALFKSYTTPPHNMTTLAYYLPLRLWHVLHVLESKAAQWKSLMRENNIKVHSDFNPKIIEYAVEPETQEGATQIEEGKETGAELSADQEKEEDQEAVADDGDFVVEELTVDQNGEGDDDVTVEEFGNEERSK